LALNSAPAGEGSVTGAPQTIDVTARVDVPGEAKLLEYYFQAVDTAGTSSTWPEGGPAAPRRVYVGPTGALPTFSHDAVEQVEPGQPVPIMARVSTAAPPARVTMHYRNVNQMHTHDCLEMLPEAPPSPAPDGRWTAVYRATIPAEHVSAEWDLMYHLEAVDVLGNAAFYPGLTAETPYVMAAVRRPTEPR
jgi:hypothetical protein